MEIVVSVLEFFSTFRIVGSPSVSAFGCFFVCLCGCA